MKFVAKTLPAAILLALLSLLVTAPAWAQDQQQSLGDIARKQKKSQDEQKEKKVFSNEDLPTTGGISSPGAASGTASSSASSTGEAAADAATPEEEKKAAAPGEPSGMTAAQQADAAKKELESLKHDEAAFDNGIKHLEDQMQNATDDSRRELYANAIQHAQKNLADTQKKREEAEKKLAEAEAAAKQAQQNQPQPEQPPQ